MHFSSSVDGLVILQTLGKIQKMDCEVDVMSALFIYSGSVNKDSGKSAKILKPFSHFADENH